MSTTEIIKAIFKEQDELNSSIAEGQDWKKLGHNYMLAATLECAEIYDHMDWKWWKSGTTNIAQVKLEIVDVLFFLVSEAMVKDITAIYAADVMWKGFSTGSDGLELEISSLMACLVLDRPRDAFNVFGKCLFELGISFEELFNLYIGKSVLNHFRKNNGYKSGTYIKNWNGLEDNEVLTQICSQLSTTSVKEAKYEIYKDLEYAYSLVG